MNTFPLRCCLQLLAIAVLVIAPARAQLIVGTSGGVAAFDLTTGAPISSFHWTLPGSPFPATVKTLTVFGNRLYVAYQPLTSGTMTIGLYDATTGAVLNASFGSISASGSPPLMAATADYLLVATPSAAIRKFDAATGAVLSVNLLGGAPIHMTSLLADGSTLFTGESFADVVTEHDIATGGAIGPSFTMPGLVPKDPKGLAFWRNNRLLVSNGNQVSAFSLLTGAMVFPAFPSMTADTKGSLAVVGDTLYMGSTSTGTVSTYDLIHGRYIDTRFANVGFGSVAAMAIATPEPSAAVLLAGAAFPLLFQRRR